MKPTKLYIMKKSTFLKRAIKTLVFLSILLVLISFKNEKPAPDVAMDTNKQLELFAANTNNQITSNNRLALDMERKDVRIILEIDTEGITESNLDSKVVFINVGDTTSTGSGNPKTFLTKVYKNKKVEWSAVPKNINSNITIDVVAIFRKEDGGAEIMDNIYVEEGKKGVVIAKIKNKKVEGIENYNVVFRINEQPPRIFVVDPKLEMGL